MEVKKNPKADLESKKGIFLQIGFIVVLAAVLFAFEWTQSDIETSEVTQLEEEVVEEEIIPVTRQNEPPPPPPPPPPKTVEVLSIVEDDVEIDDELEIEDSEIDEDTEIDFTEIIGEEAEEEADQTIFVVVEDMPEFPGGDAALRQFLASSVRYPTIAQENGIQGKVFVNFVINQKGEVEQAKVLRGVDPSLNKEALRVINSMPKWKPGQQRGKPVKVSYTVPINFVLQ